MNDFVSKTKELIDALKAICANQGLGNDGNEYKIITQVFLYKFLNDKFFYDVKTIDEKLKDNAEQIVAAYPDDKYEMLLLKLPPATARLKKEHFISALHKRMNEGDFHKLFDETLLKYGCCIRIQLVRVINP